MLTVIASTVGWIQVFMRECAFYGFVSGLEVPRTQSDRGGSARGPDV